jgi:EAL domain-containing protein (putative c-di-GMP-specific phosphodiesterase class I)
MTIGRDVRDIAVADSEARLFRRLRIFCEAAAIIVVALAGVVLFGWAFDIATLKSVIPGLVTMKANTALEFRDEHFLEGLFAVLEETGLDPGSLELELTDSVLMKRAESAQSVLQALKVRGVHIAIDDFGTGYSSLSQLGKFPVYALKIDQSFVRQITTAPKETSIVRAVISMGRSLNLRVIAEGVETQEELEFLRSHGCEEAQGYYFSRPIPAAEFAQLLTTRISETVLR